MVRCLTSSNTCRLSTVSRAGGGSVLRRVVSSASLATKLLEKRELTTTPRLKMSKSASSHPVRRPHPYRLLEPRRSYLLARERQPSITGARALVDRADCCVFVFSPHKAFIFWDGQLVGAILRGKLATRSPGRTQKEGLVWPALQAGGHQIKLRPGGSIDDLMF